MVGFPKPFDYDRSFHVAVLQPPSSDGFGLFRVRSPLLAESLLFSLPPGTKMFQFPGFLLTNSYVGSDWTLLQPGSPIRIPPDRCLFTTPRGVSPLTASFISCMCLGIHRTLFLTWSTFDFLLSSKLKNCLLLYKLLFVHTLFSVTIFSQLLRKTISICYSVFKEHSLKDNPFRTKQKPTLGSLYVFLSP